MPTAESNLRVKFLDHIYADRDGYVCIATRTPRPGQKDLFNQEFFKWPERKQDAINFIDGSRSKNLYFCTSLLDHPNRSKEFCSPITNMVWADLDYCNPDTIDPQPQIVIESSPDKFHAIWRLDDFIPSKVAEEYSKRIYEKYKIDGVDSGWALGKLLRIPFTLNVNYSSKPEVKLLRVEDDTLDPSIFESMLIDQLTEQGDEDLELPDLLELPTAESVFYAYRHQLKDTAFQRLYSEEPPEDWSASLWHLIKICFEADMSREEVFVIASTSQCNKYARDKRPITHLWNDVVKADTAKKAFSVLSGDLDETLEFPEIITDDERELITPTWINEYIDWASKVTDANFEYHEICGSILLSSLLADKLHLKVSWGKIIPNLWGLILGESSMTRKTTSMELAMEFLMETDPSLILSTQDSSVEGMMRALADRPEKVSIYYRDEVSGFFNALANKGYLAGMPEFLAKLYDVPAFLPRQLSKETITVVKPVFVFFGGGIQDRVYENVNEDFFYSGFLPRFLIVNGKSDIDNVRWIGPPSSIDPTAPRDTLKANLHDMVAQYKIQVVSAKILGQDATFSKEVEAVLTQEAWEKMRFIEQTLVMSANQSSLAGVALPTFTRLSTSLLKLAILYGASRQEPRDFTITVELRDVLQAAYFITRWAPHTIHMMTNVGITSSERSIQKILRAVRAHPGLTRAECMRRHHLQSIPAKIIFATLEERGLIQVKQSGKGFRLFPI